MNEALFTLFIVAISLIFIAFLESKPYKPPKAVKCDICGMWCWPDLLHEQRASFLLGKPHKIWRHPAHMVNDILKQKEDIDKLFKKV